MDALKDLEWTKSLAMLEDFSFETLEFYFQNRGVPVTEDSKDSKLFSEKYIHDVAVELTNEKCSQFSVKAKCHPNQEHNEEAYNLYFTFCTPDLQLIACYCSCTVGLPKACHHLTGLALYLQSLIFRGFTAIPENTPSISKPILKPESSKVDPVENKTPINTTVKKRKRDQEQDEKQANCINEAERERLRKFVKALKAIDERIPMSYLIDPENQNPSMSMLALHRKYSQTPINLGECVDINSSDSE